MVTPEHKCYYFKEGYIRMSGQKYDLQQSDNVFVHLTNNAIQKHGTNYGQYEEGNILSFKAGAVSHKYLVLCFFDASGVLKKTGRTRRRLPPALEGRHASDH